VHHDLLTANEAVVRKHFDIASLPAAFSRSRRDGEESCLMPRTCPARRQRGPDREVEAPLHRAGRIR
jgi:hypothetical protein